MMPLLTFRWGLQGNVHVTQIPIAALYHQLSCWGTSAVQGPFFTRHDAALLKKGCAIYYREGGEALRAKAPLPTDAGRPMANTFRHSRTGITCLKKKIIMKRPNDTTRNSLKRLFFPSVDPLMCCKN